MGAVLHGTGPGHHLQATRQGIIALWWDECALASPVEEAGMGTPKDIPTMPWGTPTKQGIDLSIIIIIHYYLLHARRWPWHTQGLMFQ